MPGAASIAIGFAGAALAWVGLRTWLLSAWFSTGAYAAAADAGFLVAAAAGLYFALRNRERGRERAEEKFRLITDLNSIYYWEIDADLNFTRLEGAVLREFEKETRDAIGNPSMALTDFALTDLSPEAFARLRAERKPYRDVRASIRLADGGTRHLSISGDPVFAADGTFSGYRGTTREITAQVAAEQARQRTESRFRRMVETVPHMVFFITNPARSRWDYVSSNLNSVWKNDGRIEPAKLAQALTDRILPEDRALVHGRGDAETRGEFVDIEFRVRDPVLGLRWMRTRTIGVPQAHGEVEVYGVTEDVTERHHALERISASETLHRSVIESMAEGLIVRDIEGRVITLNRAAQRMLDLTLEDSRGRSELVLHGSALHEDGSVYRPGERPWQTVLRTGQPLLGRVLSLPHRDGSRIWLRINAVPIPGADGAIERVAATLQDITAERAALAGMSELAATLERRVEERTEALKKTNRELEAFAHSVSHDLRAPLRAINGFARLLAEREGARLDGESRRLLSRVEAGAGRMGELIDDVIAYSGATRRDPVFARVDLAGLAESVVTRLAHAYPATRLEIGPLGALHADARMVEAILEALVGNALKFSAGATRPEVRIHAQAAQGRTTVQVADNGTGFDMAHAGHLFALFKRLHHDHEFPGNGVGLATVRNLVERQGGSVAAMGEPGRGATFSFQLPSAPN